jgi:hypothetical protein
MNWYSVNGPGTVRRVATVGVARTEPAPPLSGHSTTQADLAPAHGLQQSEGCGSVVISRLYVISSSIPDKPATITHKNPRNYTNIDNYLEAEESCIQKYGSTSPWLHTFYVITVLHDYGLVAFRFTGGLGTLMSVTLE